MKLGILGIGLGGTRLTDTLVNYGQQRRSDIAANALAVNTSHAELDSLSYLAGRQRLCLSDDTAPGEGCGGDIIRGVDIAATNQDTIQTAIDTQFAIDDLDAFLLIAALGGGTGGGAAPVIARHLASVYSLPVYSVAVLPAADSKSLYQINAAKSLPAIQEYSTTTLLLDNGSWRPKRTTEPQSVTACNEPLVKRVGTLFDADVGANHPDKPQTTLQTADILQTLRSGRLTTLAYASQAVETAPAGINWLRRSRTPSPETIQNRASELTELALEGRLSARTDITSTDSAVIALSGPPRTLSDGALTAAHQTLESKIDSIDIRSGVVPMPKQDYQAVSIALNGVSNCPKLESLYQRAKQADVDIPDVTTRADTGFTPLVE